jgi:hypothetical protein
MIPLTEPSHANPLLMIVSVKLMTGKFVRFKLILSTTEQECSFVAVTLYHPEENAII